MPNRSHEYTAAKDVSIILSADQCTTNPEIALSSVQDLRSDANRCIFGMLETMDALGSVRNERALDGRETDNDGLLGRRLANSVQSA
jgi:hypothetical protein